MNKDNKFKFRNKDDAFIEGYNLGFITCKKMILSLLGKDIQNCDLSWESCDRRYIEKVKGV